MENVARQALLVRRIRRLQVFMGGEPCDGVSFFVCQFCLPSSSMRLMCVGPAIATRQWLQLVLSWTISIPQHLSQLLMI